MLPTSPVQRVSPSSVSSADFTNLPMNGKRHTEQRINVRCWTEIPGTGAGSQHAATGMPIYFHVAPPGLLPGHIIQPGTWGQKMRIYGKGGQTFSDHSSAYDLIWEIVLEATRRAL